MAKTNTRAGYQLLDDEEPDIVEELKKFIDNPEPWLDEPNERLLGRKPRDLIGTQQEIHLRNLLRRIKHGDFT